MTKTIASRFGTSTAGRKMYEWNTGTEFVCGFAFTPGNALLIGGGQWSDFLCWDLKTGKPISRWNNKHYLQGLSLVLSPDAKQITAEFDDGIGIFELPSGKKLHEFNLPEGARGVVLSSNGHLLATGSGCQVHVFDLQNDKELLPLADHAAAVEDLEFSQSGDRLVSIDSGKRTIAWDLRARRAVATVRASQTAREITMSSNGRLVVIQPEGAAPRLWSVDDGAILPTKLVRMLHPVVAAASRNGMMVWADKNGCSFGLHNPFENGISDPPPQGAMFRGHLGAVLGLALAADAKTAASIGDDQTLRVWKAGSADAVVTIHLTAAPHPYVAISDDAANVAAAVGRSLFIWNSLGGNPITSIDLGDEPPTAMQFAPNGKTIALADKGGFLWLCDAATGAILRKQKAHTGIISALAFSPDGAALYSGGQDGAVNCWKSDTLDKQFSLGDGLPAVTCLAALAQGKLLAVGDSKGAVNEWDVDKRKQIHRFHNPNPLDIMTQSADGTKVATLDHTGILGRINLETNQTDGGGYWIFPSSVGIDPSVAVSSNGKLIAKALAAGPCVWKVEGRKRWKAFPTSTRYAVAVTLSHSGNLLAAGGDGFGVWKLDAETPMFQVSESQTGRIERLMFSPDDRFLIATGWEREIKIFDVASRQLVHVLSIPLWFHNKLHFTRDGRWLLVVANAGASIGQAGTRPSSHLMIWEVASGKLIGKWPMPERSWISWALSADDRQLAIGLKDGTIWVYDFPRIVKELLATPAASELATVDDAWRRLADADPATAYRAVVRMSESPAETVELLRANLPAITAIATTPAQIDALIKQLASDNPAARRDASSRLLQMKPAVHAALREALRRNLPNDVRARVELILAAKSSPSDTTLRAIRAVQVLERIASPVARELLQTLATGPADAEVTQESQAALNRLDTPRLK